MIAVDVVPDFVNKIQSIWDVWRLLCVSAAAYTLGLSFTIARDVFANATWRRLSVAFFGLVLLVLLDQLGRLGAGTFTWRLPILTFVLINAIWAETTILRHKVGPFDAHRGRFDPRGPDDDGEAP